MLNTALAYLIDVFFVLLTSQLLLRLVLQIIRAPFRNPLGQAVMALTDWIVKPLRKVLPGWAGVDWASVVAVVLFQLVWLLALYFAFGRGFALLGTGAVFLLAATLIALAKALLWLVIIVVFVQAILSWVAPDGPLAGVLNALTFPVLMPIRRIVPPLGGALDLSPLIVIVLAQLVLMLPVAWLEQTVAQLFR